MQRKGKGISNEQIFTCNDSDRVRRRSWKRELFGETD